MFHNCKQVKGNIEKYGLGIYQNAMKQGNNIAEKSCGIRKVAYICRDTCGDLIPSYRLKHRD